MPVVFHGTTEENARKVLVEGFRPNTYFASHLEDAVKVGGNHVFEVFFEEETSPKWTLSGGTGESWQLIAPYHIPAADILRLYEVTTTVLLENKDAERRMNETIIRDQYGPEAAVCDRCNGNGELEAYPPFSQWGDPAKVVTCLQCMGFGSPTEAERLKNFRRRTPNNTQGPKQ